MKNNRACRGILLAGSIFNLSFIIAYFMVRSIVIGSDVADFSNAISDITSVLSGLILLLAASLGILCVAIQGYLYNAKTEKNIIILANSIASSVIAACIILLLFGAMEAEAINISFIISIALFILNVVTILALEGKVSIKALDSYLPKLEINANHHVETNEVPSGETTGNPTSTPISIDAKKIKEFFKTKTGKQVLLAIVVCLVAFGGYKVWDVFFNKTTIDVFEKMELTYTGYDGEGSAYVDSTNPEYDKSNLNMVTFVNDIYFDVEDTGKLSNGDKVVVRAEYSKETAKDLKVVVKEDTKEFRVSGLIENFDSAKEIDKDLYKKAKESVEEELEDDSYSTYTYVGSYFGKEKVKKGERGRDYLVFVYKEDYKGYFSDEINTRYVSVDCSFDSSFDEDDIYVYASTLYTKSGERLENLDQLIDALTYSVSEDHKYEKID